MEKASDVRGGGPSPAGEGPDGKGPDEKGRDGGAHRRSEPAPPFWERPEVVERFADRPPDRRMLARLADAPPRTRALDLGCAAGRNTAWLASRGFDVWTARHRLVPVTATRSVRVAVGAGHRTTVNAHYRKLAREGGDRPP